MLAKLGLNLISSSVSASLPSSTRIITATAVMGFVCTPRVRPRHSLFAVNRSRRCYYTRGHGQCYCRHLRHEAHEGVGGVGQAGRDVGVAGVARVDALAASVCGQAGRMFKTG